MSKKSFNSNKYFNLTELIIVIVVLGILAAIIMLNISNFKSDAVVAEAKAVERNLQTAVDHYKSDHGKLPILDNREVDIDELFPDYIKNKPSDRVTCYIDEYETVHCEPIESSKGTGGDDFIPNEFNHVFPEAPIKDCNAEGFICIETVEQLMKIGVDESYPEDGKYRLGADLDFSGISDWTGIVNFEGEFDGNGYEINNLIINGEELEQAGLFNYVKNAKIYNIQLNSPVITGDRNGDLGTIAGEAHNSNFNDIVVKDGVVKGGLNTGGVFGYFSDSFAEHIHFYGKETIEGNYGTGGLIGYGFQIFVANSHANADVTSVYATSGLIGYVTNGHVYNSYARGNIYGEEYVGGIFGSASGMEVLNSYFEGSVSGQEYVGGFLGYGNSLNIKDSYAYGEVNAESFGGGFGGYISTIEAENVYAFMTLDGGETIDDCVFNFTGYSNHTKYENVYWSSEVGGKEYSTYREIFEDYNKNRHGEDKTHEELTLRETYEKNGWDFRSIWAKNKEFDHPTLRVRELMEKPKGYFD